MKPEVSERLFIEQLFKKSQQKIDDKSKISNIDKLTGDASTRRYYRVFTEEDSYVVCLDNPTEKKNTFVEIQSFLKKNNVSVPDIYDKDLSLGYILEEDLGDKTLLSQLSSLDSIEEEYNVFKAVVDELIELQSISDEKVKASNKINDQFDYDKLKSEMNFSIKFFLKLLLSIKDQQILDQISNQLGPLCVRLSQEKMILTHRDFHSRNIMIKNDQYRIIDFQDARTGIAQYDLSSLLDDCYYDLNESNRENLKKYYYNKMKDKIDQASYEVFDSLYTDMAIQRVFKAVGSFAYIYKQRGDERYLKYIGFAMEKLKKYMLKDQKYNELRKLLFGLYYES